MDTTEPVDRLDVAREKLALERARLDIEREKLTVARYKARYTAFAVAVPLLALAIAVGVGVWQQVVRARDDLALRAAEIAMAGDDSRVSRQKGQALAALLPDRLGPAFAAHLEPEKFGDTGKETVARKEQLLGLLIAHPDRRAAILAAWRVLFPADQWVAPLQRAMVERAGASKAASRIRAQPKASVSPPAPALRDDPGSARGGAEAAGMGFEIPPSNGPQEAPSSFVPR